MSRLVRSLQAVAAAAALFAMIGACGITPLSRGARPRRYPRPNRAAVTIRSLTGVWVAVWRIEGRERTVTLSLVQSGNTLAGTIDVGDLALVSDPMQPAFLATTGQFVMGFGRSDERVIVEARPDASGDILLAFVRGLAPQPIPLTFART